MICLVWEGFGSRIFFRDFFISVFLGKRHNEMAMLGVCNFSVIHVRYTVILLSVDFKTLYLNKTIGAWKLCSTKL